MSVLYGLKNYYSLFGVEGLLRVGKSWLMRQTAIVYVSIPGIRYPLTVRLRTSDVTLLRSIFLEGEYDWSFLKSPQVIIDAGANVGYASVVFANRYPEARILAIEPEFSNYESLRKNTGVYPQIQPVQAALWKEKTTLRITDPSAGNWAFRTEESNRSATSIRECGTVPALTLDNLMIDHEVEFIDILKVDIEGAEKEVFENSTSWINRVGVIIIELHDSLKQGCREAVHKAARDFSFVWTKGETTVFGRKEFGGLHPIGNEQFDANRAHLKSQLPFQITLGRD
jgi:FkbM family methyltransferase